MRRAIADLRVVGAAEWTRTTDLLITNQLLYQLSYSSLEASRRLYGAPPLAAILNPEGPA